MQGQLRHRTPDYWKCQDCQRLVSDFYAKYNDPSRALTREQRQILAASEKMNEVNEAYDMLMNPDKYASRQRQEQYRQQYSGQYGSQSPDKGARLVPCSQRVL